MNFRVMAGVFAPLALFGSTIVTTALAQDTQPTPANAAQQVDVAAFSVTGNTLLPQPLIDAALAPYTGRRSAAELQQAARAVQALYRDAGWGAVVAYLPEQPLADGRLQIVVLEGRLARVVVLGNQQFSAANVRRSLPALQEGQTPRVQAVDAQVQLANENPARRIAVTLEEGQTRGDVDARVTVAEEPVQRVTLFADNTGNAQTGRLRVGVGYQHAALWDLDHQFSAQVQVAPDHAGSVQIFNASYRVPLYAAGLMLQAYATYSSVDAGTTATAAGALSFNGKGRVAGLQAMRLFERFGEFEQRLLIGVDKRDYLNNCTIADLPAGACGTAGASVTVHPLTLEYAVSRTGERPAGANVSLSHNLALGGEHAGDADFEAVRAGARRRYDAARLAAYAALPLQDDWRIVGRLAAQATRDALVPGEQFGLTGAAVVRGYEEREVTGDSGVAASVEALSPLFGAPAVRSTGPTGATGAGWDGLRLAAFADAGWVRNRFDLPCNGGSDAHCRAAAVGVGLRFNVWGSSWKFDLARALNDARQTQRGDLKLHFQASVALQ